MDFKEFNKLSEQYVADIQKDKDIDENFDLLLGLFAPVIKTLISKTKYPTCIEYDDLYQESVIMLWKCCKNYNSNQGTFYTYYYRCVSNALYEYVFTHQSLIKVNKHERERNKDLRFFAKTFFKENDVYPVLEDYLKAGFEEKQVKKYLDLLNLLYVEDTDISDMDIMTSSFEDDLIKEIDCENIKKEINNLPEPHKTIITSRYYDNENYSQIESKTGLCSKTIKKYEIKALELLKAKLKKE